MDVDASSVVSGSWREGENETSWAEVRERTARSLPPTPGFRGAAVVALEMEQGAVGGAGAASISMQGLAPSPVQELLTPFVPAALISQNSLI